MTKSDLKYYVEEIQTHKFYTQLNKKGEKLYLFEIGDREDRKLSKMRACVIDVTGAQVYYTDWFRSADQLGNLLESLNLEPSDLIEVDSIVSVVTE